MFTGIITDVGTILDAQQRGDLWLKIGCAYPADGIAIGASIACSGTCLTVIETGCDGAQNWFAVQLSAETVGLTVPGRWQTRQRLNLERALKMGDELGGHIVTGHVDGVGEVISVASEGESIRIDIAAPADLAAFIAGKGSITVDGVSLTVNSVTDLLDGRAQFGLNIIPHTGDVTTLGALTAGALVNLEIDTLARYLKRMQAVLAGV